jgi:hypothetical protein
MVSTSFNRSRHQCITALLCLNPGHVEYLTSAPRDIVSKWFQFSILDVPTMWANSFNILYRMYRFSLFYGSKWQELKEFFHSFPFFSFTVKILAWVSRPTQLLVNPMILQCGLRANISFVNMILKIFYQGGRCWMFLYFGSPL